MMHKLREAQQEAKSELYREIESMAFEYMDRGHDGMIVCIWTGNVEPQGDSYVVSLQATATPLDAMQIDTPDLLADATRFLQSNPKGHLFSTTLYDFRGLEWGKA